jgi:hypothetical protein
MNTAIIERDEWFERIKLFNTRPEKVKHHKLLSNDYQISLEFGELLKKCGIQTRIERIPYDNYSDKPSFFYMYTWCSDWSQYENNLEKPVLYIDAHYDVVYKRMITPQRLSADIVVASCFDNRASCNILCKAIEESVFANKEYLIYILFSDGEERGMTGFSSWFMEYRTFHKKERFIVMDVTNNIHDNLGLGVYRFMGDPLEEIITCRNFMEQIATHRESYPGNLCYTHGSLLFHMYKCDVGRIGMPVGCLHLNRITEDTLHSSHSVISLSDMNNYYLKLLEIIKNIKFCEEQRPLIEHQ